MSKTINQTQSDFNASLAMQRYAAEIFRLEQDHGMASLSLVAEAVDASHQAVARMIQRMTKGGFTIFKAYKGVRLTHKGKKIAMPAIRRHRLGEVFLVNMMGYDWADAHQLADQFEKGLVDELVERIADLCGDPKYCPHGEPIPDRDGKITIHDDKALIDEQIGESYRISRVRTHNLDKLKYLDKLEMRPGLEFFYVSKAPFRGPLRMRYGKSDRVIGFELASSFWVEKITDR